MNQLFNCRNIRWNGVEYEELPDEELVAIFADDEDEDEDEDEEAQEETQEVDEEE